ATAASGSTFAGWGGACTGTGTSVTVTVSDDTSCTVSFTKPTATGQTVQPQTGWWWSANEPGRGYSIEARNNGLFLAAYMYSSSGPSVWYV
ncbi:hypothetical protein ABTN31_18890, partial [Acinetobacter baumannii]